MLARHTQAAIDAGDRAEVRRCFRFAESAAMNGDAAVSNAIGVSYLEHLILTDGKVARRWALAELPPRLAEDLRSLS